MSGVRVMRGKETFPLWSFLRRGNLKFLYFVAQQWQCVCFVWEGDSGEYSRGED